MLRKPSTETSNGNPAPLHIAEIRGKVHAGIITVRMDEFSAVLKRFPQRQLVTGGRRLYEFAQLDTAAGKIGALICRCPELGVGDAYEVTTDMLQDLIPPWLFLVGIAGAFPDNEFTLGDVIIATRVVDFTVNAALEGKGTQLDARGGPMHRDVLNLVAHLPAEEGRFPQWNTESALDCKRPQEKIPGNPEEKDLSTKFYGSADWRQRVHNSLFRQLGGKEPRASPIQIAGPNACGNVLLKDTALAQQWKDAVRSLVTVEMELAGAYRAVHQFALGECRLTGIRGISDIIGYARDPDWTAYACHTAASFAHALMTSGILMRITTLPSTAFPQAEPGKSPRLNIQQDLKEPLSAVLDSGLTAILTDYAVRKLALLQSSQLRNFRLPHMLRVANANSISAAEAINKYPRLVILGYPGTGKTVLLQKTLRASCMALLRPGRGKVRPTPKTLSVLLELASCGVPASLDLSALILDQLSLDSPPLPAHLSPTNLLVSLLRESSVILQLLMDGFNELPPGEPREQLAKELFALENAIAEAGLADRLRVVVTSRFYGFSNLFEKPTYIVANLERAELKAIEGELAASGISPEFYAHLASSEREFLATPQHLDYFVQWCRDHPPSRSKTSSTFPTKGDLLQSCVRKKFSAYTEEEIRLIYDALSKLAYSAVESAASFDYKQVLASLQSSCIAFGSASSPKELTEALFQNGLLVDTGERCRFVHHSIQQYFTASRMRVLWNIHLYCSRPEWHEPLVLLAGLVDDEHFHELHSLLLPNTLLHAYVLAGIRKPGLQREFLEGIARQFTRKVTRAAIGLLRLLKLGWIIWFLSLPAVAAALSQLSWSSLPDHMKLAWALLLAAYSVVVPFFLTSIYSKRFRTNLRTIRDVHLPEVITVSRILFSPGTLKAIHEDLTTIQETLACGKEDPRMAFLSDAIHAVANAATIPSYFKDEDEKLALLDDPLVVATIEPDRLSDQAVERLLQHAAEIRDSEQALRSFDVLIGLYKRASRQNQIRQVLFTLATEKHYSRRRRKRAAAACLRLGISLPREPSRLLRLLKRLLAFLLPSTRRNHTDNAPPLSGLNG